jgi:ABC-type amino acid transport substrate-binding protein
MFHGYEFAWAQEKHPGLRPLALAVNGYRYPVMCVAMRKDGAAGNFAQLRGTSMVMTGGGVGCPKLFIDRQCLAAGAEPKEFFSRIAVTENVEDALDDAVDGKVQAVVVDQAGLDAYKRRKPGRYRQLKIVARSQPFPAVVLAYNTKTLTPTTLHRFRDGLLSADKKEKGQTLLTFFRVTRFEKVPADFDRVLAETRAAYPAPGEL